MTVAILVTAAGILVNNAESYTIERHTPPLWGAEFSVLGSPSVPFTLVCGVEYTITAWHPANGYVEHPHWIMDPADINFDGQRNSADLAAFRANVYDWNRDSATNVADLFDVMREVADDRACP